MYEFAIGKLTESNIDLEAAGGLSVEKKKQKRKRKKGVSYVLQSVIRKDVLSMVKVIREKEW